LSISCDGCPRGGGFTAPAVVLGMGGTLNPHVRVGLGIDLSWVSSPADTENMASNVTAIVRYYPSTRGGLFVEGGLGVSQGDVSTRGNPDVGYATGLGFTVAVGCEVPRWSAFSVMPRVAYDYGLVGDVTYPHRGTRAVAPNWKHRMLLVGIALSINGSRFGGP
jgi:hypothetical protein